ncbi:sperm-associated antigen 6-like [Cotesia glomerata]|uniref:sperm-associated antigen 6-like n=1 Tax=Cotesia glomerata TaxID=32391 RepID=UPI001D02DEEA|nr:sperm-associated antigen 6-like [Cotesia glomerata]XP_044591882.1 sperm-associated antigen 6-like [Cotesia glomerata]
MTANRGVSQAFTEYQAARLRFVQTISDLSSRSHNIEGLEKAGVLDLLEPLLFDVLPSIQQTAIATLGKLTNHEEKLAYTVVKRDIVPKLLENFNKQNKFYKKSTLYLFRTISKHSEDLANFVVDVGGISAIFDSLGDLDFRVKENAVWAVGYIARHSEDLALKIVTAGVVPLLVLCLQEPDHNLKHLSASALYDISKHTPELAQAVVDNDAIIILAKLLMNEEVKLKRQVLLTLGSIAKHSTNLAESVVEADIFPSCLLLMGHPDDAVRKNAAILTREISKHTLELAQLVANAGGIAALIEFISTTFKSSTKLPGIMALGYIAGHSDQIAIAIIGSQGVVLLSKLLMQEIDDSTQAIIVWALGQLGKHSPEHAQAVAVTNIFPKFIQLYMDPKSSQDLKTKIISSFKNILPKCSAVDALEPLLGDSPPEILSDILQHLSEILPSDPKSRRSFVTSGGLKKIQQLQTEPESKLNEFISTINSCYPEEIIRYFSPGYPDILLEKIEQYTPKLLTGSLKNYA